MRRYGSEVYITKFGRTRLGDSTILCGDPRLLLGFYSGHFVSSPAIRFQCLAGDIRKSDNEDFQLGSSGECLRAQLDRDVDCDNRLLDAYSVGHICLASSTICARDNSDFNFGVFFLGSLYTLGINIDGQC